MKKATKKEVLEMAMDYQRKYEELVWYARKSSNDLQNPIVEKHCERIEGMYPKDVENLLEEDSDFFHGFNSGMLAGMRLITSMMEIDVEYAQQNFPELDT